MSQYGQIQSGYGLPNPKFNQILRGLEINQDILIEHINKRPIYSYGDSFDPLSLSPALWLDANDSSTITTVSGVVSEWRDKSGNNRHATQETAGNRPLFVANGLNGTDVIRFDSDFMVLPTISSVSSQYSFFFILKPLVQSTLEYLFDNNSPRLVIVHRSNNGFLSVYNNGAFQDSNINSGYNTAQLLLFELGSNITITKNAQTISSPSVYVSQSLNSVIYLCGNTVNPSTNFFNGDISQIIIFPRVLTQAEREQVEGYLAWSTGLEANLPTNHPYKNSNILSGSSIVNLSNWSVNSARPKARIKYQY